MFIDWALISGYILAAAFGTGALYSYFKMHTLHSMLDAAAKRFELGKKAYLDLEKRELQQRAELEQTQLKATRFESMAEDGRVRSSAMERELENLRAVHQEAVRISERDIENLSSQVEALTAQLLEADREAKDRNERIRKPLQEEIDRLLKNNLDLDREVHSLKQENKLLQIKATGAEKLVAQIDPLETLRVKRRAQNLDQLFKSMKGLRELAEERNRNWEVALAHLSDFVLANANQKKEEFVTLGEKVAKALEITGGSLIQDDFSIAGAEAEMPLLPPNLEQAPVAKAPRKARATKPKSSEPL
jgi:hypothetical protein